MTIFCNLTETEIKVEREKSHTYGTTCEVKTYCIKPYLEKKNSRLIYSHFENCCQTPFNDNNNNEKAVEKEEEKGKNKPTDDDDRDEFNQPTFYCWYWCCSSEIQREFELMKEKKKLPSITTCRM